MKLNEHLETQLSVVKSRSDFVQICCEKINIPSHHWKIKHGTKFVATSKKNITMVALLHGHYSTAYLHTIMLRLVFPYGFTD